jgi:glycosyltransferase involved in cell wall biosynthesis
VSGIAGVKIAYLCLQATTPGQASYAHVHEIIGGLRGQGAEVDLYEPAYAGSNPPGALGRLLEFWRVQTRLIRQLRSYDLLYVRNHAFAWRASHAARARDIPVVQECNGMVDDFFIAWPAARWVSWLITRLTLGQLRDATEVIANSEGLGSWIERTAGRSARAVPAGANVEVFKPAPRPDVPLPERYAVFFGSLAPWQGTATSLEALSRPEWPDGVSLVVMGDGVLRSQVEEAASRDDRVVYLGKVAYDEVGPIVANSLCSLVNKEQPEFADAGISPLKLYESMACGVPVIATAGMPGLTDVVEERGAGLVIPQGDPSALAGAVAAIADSPAQAAEMGARGRTFVDAEASWDARAMQTAAVLERALANSESTRQGAHT